MSFSSSSGSSSPPSTPKYSPAEGIAWRAIGSSASSNRIREK